MYYGAFTRARSYAESLVRLGFDLRVSAVLPETKPGAPFGARFARGHGHAARRGGGGRGGACRPGGGGCGPGAAHPSPSMAS